MPKTTPEPELQTLIAETYELEQRIEQLERSIARIRWELREGTATQADVEEFDRAFAGFRSARSRSTSMA